MAFTINLYKVSDEMNKLHKTLGTAKTFTGTLRDSCAIEAPEVLIEYSTMTSGWPDILRYNYAYIDQFKRYYYFSEMPEIVSTGLWRIRLTEDVLMSHATAIGGHSAFVIRNENTYNNKIDDPLTVATGVNIAKTVAPSSTSWNNCTSFTGKRFVVAVSNVIKFKDTNDTELFPAGLNVMYLYGDYAHIRESIRDILAADLGSDPSSYISDVYMLPFVPTGNNTVKSITFRSGGASEEVTMSAGGGGNLKEMDTFFASHSWNIPLPTEFFALPHSVRNSKYVKMSVYFPPFGSIEIDPSYYCDAVNTPIVDTVTLFTHMNTCTGDAQLVLGPKPTAVNQYVIGSANCCLQFPYAGGQVTTSAQRMQTIISGVGALGATLVGGVGAGAAAVAANTIRSAASLAAGSLPLFSMSAGSTKGGASGYFLDRPRLVISYRGYVQPDPALYGRPLNETRQLSTLSGFTQVGSAHVGISGASKKELEEIENLLASGIVI